MIVDDAISRQAVLKIFEDMFIELQKAHQKDTQLGVNWCINTLKDMSPVNPQPCEDAISREWLMRKATERFYTTNYFNHISAMIEEAPSVTQLSTKDYLDMADRKAKKIKDALTVTQKGDVKNV